MTRTGLVALALSLSAAACSGEGMTPPANPTPGSTPTSSASAGSTAAPQAAPAPPAFRLPDTATPTRMAVALTLVPAEDTFRGVADVEMTVAKPTKVLWLHAAELQISEATLEVGGAKWTARVVPGGEHFAGFAFDEDVPAGPAKLHVVYTGRVSASDDRGVFREKDGDGTYLYSQFESIEARHAFPCFDEPQFKIPYQITLRVKQSDTAISNTPIVEEKQEADGWKTVRFAETKPLPTYLVAFAVGPFEWVDAGKTARNKAPLRFAVPRGKKAEAAYSARVAPQVLDKLEQEFGIPYPYEKLDFVIIPELASFGAMENAGMITVGARFVLAKPGDDTHGFQEEAVAFMAHEAAHQWFGDLVTMKWWDDIWLNEGFATWMEAKVTHAMDATFGADLRSVGSAHGVMSEDGLLSARKVRQEVLSDDDISNAFDGITYQKGSAVLATFESWLGAPAFQKGVRRYLDKFSFKNATSDDFLSAVSEGAGKDIKAAMSTFLDQPGVPVVSAKLSCDASGAKLALSQERFLPLGSKGSAADGTWQIPVCARYGAKKASAQACTLLTGKTGELKLPAPSQGAACPDWVTLKSGGIGYYRAAYTPADVKPLLAKKGPLSDTERLAVVSDLRALAVNARFPMGDALARLPDLLDDPSPQVQGAAVSMALWLGDDYVDPDMQPNVRRFVAKVLAPRVKALGWTAAKKDLAATRRYRAQLLDTFAYLGDEPKHFADADKLARKWLDDPQAIDSESVEPILRAAAVFGDRKLFDRVSAMAQKETDGRRRAQLIGMLAAFHDPELIRAAITLFLDGKLDPRASMGLWWAQPHRNLPVVWEHLKANFDAVMERVPGELRQYVLAMGNDFCTEARRADVEAFMKDRAPKITGAARISAQALENISLCIARREAHRESLRAFLKKQ